MTRIARVALAAASFVLVAAGVLVFAPRPVEAASSITGVPASIAWPDAVAGGTEVRVLVSLSITISNVGTPYTPTIGTSPLCRQGSSCTGLDAIPASAMFFAAKTDDANNGDSDVKAHCAHHANTVASKMFGTSPQSMGAYTAAFIAGWPLCGDVSGAGTGGVGCTSCTVQSGTLTIVNFYIGIDVPAGTHPGHYTGTLTFTAN